MISLTNKKLQWMILTAIFAALTAIGAFIKIPTPTVPFTLQFFFCAFAGLLLGKKYGLYSQLLYIFIGLAGMPVFTNGGGPSYLLQPTFGYLIGFALCAFIIGAGCHNKEKLRFFPLFFTIVFGLLIVYLFGILHLYIILDLYLGKTLSFMQLLWIGFLPYILFDVLQSAIIAWIALKVMPLLRKSGYLQ